MKEKKQQQQISCDYWKKSLYTQIKPEFNNTDWEREIMVRWFSVVTSLIYSFSGPYSVFEVL